MKVSFSKTSTATPPPAQATSTASTELAVTETPSMAVAAPDAVGGDNGWKRRVMQKPYLSIGHRTGDLTAEHPEFTGKLIYDKTVPLPEPARIIVVGMQHGYEEDKDYNSEGFPDRFASEAQAIASGKPFYDTVQLDLLIECDPAHDLAQFSMLEIGDKCYAPALFGTKKKTMRRTAGVIVRDEMAWLKGDTRSGFYQLLVALDTSAQNPYFIAYVKADGAVSKELRNAIKEKFGC